jgi:hypothetical protein
VHALETGAAGAGGGAWWWWEWGGAGAAEPELAVKSCVARKAVSRTRLCALVVYVFLSFETRVVGRGSGPLVLEWANANVDERGGEQGARSKALVFLGRGCGWMVEAGFLVAGYIGYPRPTS